MVLPIILEDIGKCLGNKVRDGYLKLKEHVKLNKFFAYDSKMIDDKALVIIVAAESGCMFKDVYRLGSQSTFSDRKLFFQRINLLKKDGKIKQPRGRPIFKLVLNNDKFKEFYGDMP